MAQGSIRFGRAAHALGAFRRPKTQTSRSRLGHHRRHSRRLSGAIGGEFINSSNIPGAESPKAIDLLDERFPAQSGDSATIVFQSSSGVNDPTVKSEIDAVLASAAALPNVVNVASPFEANGAISADGTIAYAAVLYDDSSRIDPAESVDELTALVDRFPPTISAWRSAVR